MTVAISASATYNQPSHRPLRMQTEGMYVVGVLCTATYQPPAAAGRCCSYHYVKHSNPPDALRKQHQGGLQSCLWQQQESVGPWQHL